MKIDDTDSKIRLDSPAGLLRQMQIDYRLASLRASSPAGKEAIKKLRHSHEFEKLLRDLPPPHSPSVILYPLESKIEHRGWSATDPEETAEGPFLEFGDEINPPYTTNRRTAYQEIVSLAFCGHVDDECREWGDYVRQEGTHQPSRAASAWAISAGYEDIPDHCRVICGFITRISVDDYIWEWLTVKSNINSYFSHIEVDSRDFSPSSIPNPTFAIVSANHVLDIWLDCRIVTSKRKTIVSREITEPELFAYDFDERIGSELTEKCRILGGKELEIFEYIELEVASDGWAKIAGNFTWGKLQTWWDGLGISQADLDPRFKIEEIFRRG